MRFLQAPVLAAIVVIFACCHSAPEDANSLVLRTYDVPRADGLAKLRERMIAVQQRPWSSMFTTRRLVPIAAPLAIAAVVLLFWYRRPPDLVAAARQRAGVEQVALGLAPASNKTATLTDEQRATAALAEVPTSNPTVAFYWVSSTTARVE